MNVTLPNGVVIEGVPDGATKQQIMQKAITAGLASEADFGLPAQPSVPAPQQSAQDPLASQISDVPGAEQDAAVADYYAQQQAKPARTMADRAIGAGETALSAISGATLGTAGTIAGTVEQAGRELLSGQYGTPEAADRIEQYAADVANVGTYSPRTEAGQQYTQKLGEIAAPFAGLGGLSAQMNVASNAARMSPRFASVSKASGAPNQQAISEIEAIKSGDPLIAPVGKKLSSPTIEEPQRVIKDKPALSLMRSGVDERFTNALKDLSPIDKKKTAAMVDIIERGDKSLWISRYTRPSDIVGDSLKDRIVYVKGENKKAGLDVDKAAKMLVDEVDSDVAFNNVLARLDDMGVRIDDEGVPLFKRSEVQGFAPDEKVIGQVVGRMREAKTAKDLHNLKKYIYNNVHFGKRSEGGLTGKTEVAMKEFARDINKVIAEKYPEYGNANAAYSETIQALDDLQGAAGQIDLIGEGSEQALGSRARALLSNQQKRVDLKNAIQGIDATAKKYGGTFDDDILKQAAIVDELERIYGTQATTSMGGELSKLGQDVINKGIYGTATDKAFSLLKRSEEKRRKDSIIAIKKILKGSDK